MSFSLVVLTPSHRCQPELAIAAVRAGEIGLLDIGSPPTEQISPALDRLQKAAADSDRWGIRISDVDNIDTLSHLAAFFNGQLPYLLLAGVREHAHDLRALRNDISQFTKRAFIEVYDLDQAIAAEQAGFDGIVLKGHESGGRVSRWSSLLFLQKVQGRLSVPYWIQGGIGPQTAAAARLAGAAGVVLGEQLWLAEDSSCDRREREMWQRLDGSETQVIGSESLQYRYFGRSGRATLENLSRQAAADESWHDELRKCLVDQRPDNFAIADGSLIALGQDIAFAASLAQKFGTVGRILAGIRNASTQCIRLAESQRALAPKSPLAAMWKTEYPIAQGPMTRVSDVAGFAECVAAQGGLPFLALALLREPQVRSLLVETKQQLGDRPWGVGILGFVPPELRKEQLPVVLEVKPDFAIIAGGRPSQAAELEQCGIETYLHVPSPGLLETFYRDGARKFIFEGRECGGHVGPRTSFVLWQSAIDTLLACGGEDLASVHVLFAGGIHDALSAGLVSVLAAPLVERGVKIGVLMGTSYLFTHEAVQCGAISPEFQQQALRCNRTALLESGTGHATRCAPTPFVDEFQAKKRELILAGKSTDEIRLELEMLNIGRLRLASKGLMRTSGSESIANPEKKSEISAADEETQRRMGMYMIGDVATLRDKTLSMRELHDEVTVGSVDVLERRMQDLAPVVAGKPSRSSEPLAIVGMGCLFPDSPNIRSYWENIIRRFDAIREVPPDRWQIGDFYSDNRFERDRVYSKWGSFLDKYIFDPFKYRIPPAALASIEPIQLLALEVAEQALNDAGFQYEGFPRERTAVVFGAAGTHDVGLSYAFRTMVRHHLAKITSLSEETRQQIYAELEEQLPEWTEDSFAGFLLNVVAGRISNRFDLRGPNFTVDAACASSIAALHMAVEQLRSGTCDAALVGAVDATNNPFCFMSFAKTHALSPTGKSRPYDKNADGIGLGEGLGAVVLKRLRDAERDGDKIYSVILGVGSSSDGRNRSMTAPFPDGQVLAIRRAYEDAAIDPSRVTLVEAHSTGTAVGDRVELEALQRVFPSRNGAGRTCAIGSVKSNIGHTKTSAGLASLIKTSLALQQKTLPATIGVREPNEQFTTESCPFYVNTDNRPWFSDPSHLKRCAGLSAFGFGGTNFHVVLEEYDGTDHDARLFDLQPRDAELFVWQADSREALIEQLKSFANELADLPANLAQLAASVNADSTSNGATRFARCAIVASSLDDLRKTLQSVVGNASNQVKHEAIKNAWIAEGSTSDFADTCFLFPGQGSQSLDMLKDLVLANRWSYRLFEHMDSLVAEQFPERLSTNIFPLSTFTPADRGNQQVKLNDTRVAQPALGLMDVFACELLRSFGVNASFTSGHSYGEYVALWAAGVFSTEALLALSAERGQLAYEASQEGEGAMAAVFADAETTARHLSELGVAAELANLNSDDQTVIAGTTDAIDAALAKLPSRGVEAKRISVTAAFHTVSLEPAAQALGKRLETIQISSPNLTVYSNTTAETYPEDPADIAHLLAAHIVRPVRFAEQIQRLYDAGARTFLEVGPGGVLTRLVARILKNRPHTVIPLDGGTGAAWAQLGKLLGQLFVAGKPVAISRWCDGRGLRSISVGEYLQELRTQRIRKPTDWIISPAGGRPAVATALNAKKRLATQTQAPSNGAPAAVNGRKASNTSHNQDEKTEALKRDHLDGESVPAVIARFQLPEDDTMPDSSNTNGQQLANGHASPPAGAAPPRIANAIPDVLTGFQQVMAQWLDLQKGQMRINERFLEAQENIMRASLGMDIPAAAQSNGKANSSGAAMAGPQRSTPQGTSVGWAVAPAPVLPALTPSQAAATASPADQLRAVVSSRHEDVGTSATVSNGKGPQTQKASFGGTPNSNGQNGHQPATPLENEAPPVEQFRKDLLDAVSQRTGYPIEMLDENAALEAELGIDSIKTVEIFSSLTNYHAFLPGGDDNQEETLSTFSRMKTLRDIVSVYEQRRNSIVVEAVADVQTPEALPTPPQTIHVGSNGAGDASPKVERYTLETIAAFTDDTTTKKKTSPDMISS